MNQKKSKMIPILVSMGLCVVALTAGVAYYSAMQVPQQETKEPVVQSQIKTTPVVVPQTPTLDTAVSERETSSTETTQSQDIAEVVTTETATAKTNTATKTQTQDVFVWPVTGEIVLEYSVEKAIYDPTLEQYRTNDTLCIASKEGTTVKASADGTVLSVTEDAEHGTMVTVEHQNGIRTTYSPLQPEGLVTEGTTIKQGDTIGILAKPTKYQSALGEHLCFGMIQNEQSIDPKTKLPNT